MLFLCAKNTKKKKKIKENIEMELNNKIFSTNLFE